MKKLSICMKKTQNSEGIILSLCGIFYSIGYAFDTFEEYDKWLPIIRKYRLQLSGQISIENKALLTIAALYALVLRAPRHDSSSIWVHEAQSLLNENIDIEIQIQLMLPLAYFYIFSGQLAKAESLLKAYNQRVDSESISPVLKIILGNGNTFLSWLAADFDRCQAFCEHTLLLSEDTGIFGMNFFITAHGAAGALSKGNVEMGDHLLTKMESLLGFVGAWSKGYFYNLCVWKDLIESDHGKAENHSDLAFQYSEASGSPFTFAYAHWAKSLVFNFYGEKEKAHQKINEALKLCDKFGSLQIKFGCLLTKALYAFEGNHEVEGYNVLEQAISLGRQKSFFNTFFWLSDGMSFLCGKALEFGIYESYVRKLIVKRKLTPHDHHLHLKNWPWPIRIFTLGRFDILINDAPLKFQRKAPQKPIALLKALVAAGARNVPVTVVMDVLWPELEGDAAYSAFTTCMHRLRKILRDEGTIHVQDGKISLNNRQCWVDLWPYERLLNQAVKHWLFAQNDNKKQQAVELTESIITQNKGAFLPGEFELRVPPVRERVKSKLIACLRHLIHYYQDLNQWENAIMAIQKAIETDMLVEEFYRNLMLCYHKLGRRSEIISTYELCKANLSKLSGLNPSMETENLYRTLT